MRLHRSGGLTASAKLLNQNLATVTCIRMARGRWSQNLTATKCQNLCRSCAKCRYISFSERYADCSCYAECDLSALQTTPAGFTTGFVNGSCIDGTCLRKLHRLRHEERERYQLLRQSLVAALKKRHAAERAFLDASEAVHKVQQEMASSRREQARIGIKFSGSATALASVAQPVGSLHQTQDADSLIFAQRLVPPSYYKDDPFVVRTISCSCPPLRNVRYSTSLLIAFRCSSTKGGANTARRSLTPVRSREGAEAAHHT